MFYNLHIWIEFERTAKIFRFNLTFKTLCWKWVYALHPACLQRMVPHVPTNACQQTKQQLTHWSRPKQHVYSFYFNNNETLWKQKTKWKDENILNGLGFTEHQCHDQMKTLWDNRLNIGLSCLNRPFVTKLHFIFVFIFIQNNDFLTLCQCSVVLT